MIITESLWGRIADMTEKFETTPTSMEFRLEDVNKNGICSWCKAE